MKNFTMQTYLVALTIILLSVIKHSVQQKDLFLWLLCQGREAGNGEWQEDYHHTVQEQEFTYTLGRPPTTPVRPGAGNGN